MNNRNQSGVTLIELMIAITLVAMLSSGLLFAMRGGLLTEQRISTRLAANRRGINIQNMLNRQLAGAIPVMGLCEAAEGPASSLPFFQGTETWLRFVSSFSTTQGDRGAPQIVEYQVQAAPGGRWRLAIAERPYSGPASTASFCRELKPLPVNVGPTPFVAADQLLVCRFAYHERHNIYVYEETPWLLGWDRPMLPSAVRIDMQPSEFTALPFSGITAVLRTDRSALIQYVDQ